MKTSRLQKNLKAPILSLENLDISVLILTTLLTFLTLLCLSISFSFSYKALQFQHSNVGSQLIKVLAIQIRVVQVVEYVSYQTRREAADWRVVGGVFFIN